VGAIAIIWSIWLCRNDKVFNDKISSLLQVIYRCTSTLRLWSSLQKVEHHDMFTEVCSPLEATARDTFSQHGWQLNLRLRPWWCVVGTQLGTPRGRYNEHSSKFSLSCETKVYQTSRRKNHTSEGWCPLALRHSRQWHQISCRRVAFHQQQRGTCT
jgi:hypothetical protein